MLLGGAQRSTSWVSNYPDLQRSNQLWILESRSNITRQTHSWWDRSAALSSQYLTCSNTHLCFWISGWIQLFVPKEANLPGIQRKGEVSLKQNFCIFASLLLLFFNFHALQMKITHNTHVCILLLAWHLNAVGRTVAGPHPTLQI